METFLIRALELICSLSLLVIIHEFGHFCFARLFGVRVEKYYVFFNPYYSLMRWKKFQGKWHFKFFSKNDPEIAEDERQSLPDDDWRHYPDSTEWGIGWLPLGGYCAIAGMVDETHNAAQLSAVAQPWEFRGQKSWKRLLIIVGGVLFNFLAAGIIYGAILFHYGEEYLPLQNARMGEQFSETLLKQGFQQGDQVLTIDGDSLETLSDVSQALLLDKNVRVGIRRQGQAMELLMPNDLAEQVMEANEQELMQYRFPFVAKQVQGGSAGAHAGMQEGDRLLMIDSVPTPAFQDVVEQLTRHAGDSITLQIVRQGRPMELTAQLDESGKLGVGVEDYRKLFPTRVKEYSFFRSIPAGFGMVFDQLSSYARSFKLIFTKSGAKQMGGFGAIGSLFPPHWDWLIFWNLSAFISIILGFMNILPIPALDGGYVLFILIEMLTGKKPSEKWMERLTNGGFAILLALIVYANLNDIVRFFLK